MQKQEHRHPWIHVERDPNRKPSSGVGRGSAGGFSSDQPLSFSPEHLRNADLPEIDLQVALTQETRRRFLVRPNRRNVLVAVASFLAVITIGGFTAVATRSSPSDAASAPAVPPSLSASPTATEEPMVDTTTQATPSGAVSAPTETTSVPTPTTTLPTPTTTLSEPTTTLPELSEDQFDSSPSFIEPADLGYSVGVLGLHYRGMGPLRFGDSMDEVLSSLAATFDQPDADTGFRPSQDAFGLCPGEEVREVRWEALTVVFQAEDDGTASFSGFRVDGRLESAQGPSVELKTISGLAIGDTVEQLRTIYEGRFEVVVAEPATGPSFELRSGSTSLLWGPLSSTEDAGRVEGIFSASDCAT